MTETERVNAAWTRIENWLEQNAPSVTLSTGAPAAEIQALESVMNLTFPEGLRTSLLRHNGVDEPNWPKGTLNSLGDIKHEWGIWTNPTQEEAEQGVGEEDKIQKCWFSKSWIPIDADGAGNGACVDLKPGPAGIMGQIIDMDHETGPNGPLFSDYAYYLEDIANTFETGEYPL